MAERSGVSGEIGHTLLELQRQLFEHWHHWRDGRIPWLQLQESCGPTRRQFEATLQQAVDLGCERGERTPWVHTVRTCRQLLQRSEALWTFLEKEGLEPTNNAAERALRQAMIHRRISHGVQSATGALCRSRLLTLTATLHQQGRDVWGPWSRPGLPIASAWRCRRCCQIAEQAFHHQRLKDCHARGNYAALRPAHLMGTNSATRVALH